MKVFLAATSLAPAYGGPAFSVSALSRALASAGVEVGLWSADGSVETTPLLSDAPDVNRLLGGEAETLAAFRADIIHDNGVWLSHNHRLAVLAATRGLPRIVSTRGMLEPWAMKHKRWKKALAWKAYQEGDLRRAQRLHATGAPEAANLERLGLGPAICSIPNGVDLGPPRGAHASRPGPRTALFLGRIYPVKGLPMLVEAWARVRPAGWTLRIAGPDEAGHQAVVEQTVVAAGLAEVVSFAGSLDAEAKLQAFHDADLLVLPSHSESFGMAVAEGLAHELPVLTTTAVPWPDLEDRGCGWRVPPTVEGLAEGLRAATACEPAVLRAMGARGRAYVEADFGWRPIAERFTALYEDLLAERSGARTAAAG